MRHWIRRIDGVLWDNMLQAAIGFYGDDILMTFNPMVNVDRNAEWKDIASSLWNHVLFMERGSYGGSGSA